MAVAFALDQWEVAALQGSLGSVGAGVIAAGTSGAAHGAIASGTLKGTLLSAGEALANFGIGQIGGEPNGDHYYDLGNVAARGLLHAAAGGLFSVAEGGHYKSGFLAAGFVALAGPELPSPDNILDRLLGYAESAVIGGIGSTLGGGKFENGAVTGAFEYLYNDLANHRGRDRSFYAAADGTIDQEGMGSAANQHYGYGEYIQETVEDGQHDGTIMIYAHLDAASLQVAVGDHVTAGQYLGQYADPTNGLSNGPHLHFEWRDPSDMSDAPSRAMNSGFLGKVLNPSSDLSTVMPNHLQMRGIQYNSDNTKITHPGFDLVGPNQ
jgi:hypothetical protein